MILHPVSSDPGHDGTSKGFLSNDTQLYIVELTEIDIPPWIQK